MTEQTLFSTVEMCQFSFRFFPMSFFPTKRVESKSNLYLSSWHCCVLDCVCMHRTSFHLHTFDINSKAKTPNSPCESSMNVHVGRVLDLISYIIPSFPALPSFPCINEKLGGAWAEAITSLISDIIFLYQLAQAHPHNVLHFLVMFLYLQ